MIGLNIKSLNVRRRNKGYWKFNANLLNSEDFCQGIKHKAEVSEDCSFSSNVSKWEY